MNRRTLILATAVAICLTGSAGADPGQIPATFYIDSFDAGPFSFSSSFGSVTDTQTVTSDWHVLGKERIVTLSSQIGNPVSGALIPTAPPSAAILDFESDTRCGFAYQFDQAIDLTECGWYAGIRVLLDVTFEDPASLVVVELALFDGGGHILPIEVDTAGTHELFFAYSWFDTIDPTNVDELWVRLITEDPSVRVRVESIDRWRFPSFLLYDLGSRQPHWIEFLASLFSEQGRAAGSSHRMELSVAGASAPPESFELVGLARGDSFGSSGGEAGAVAHWLDPAPFTDTHFELELTYRPEQDEVQVVGLPSVQTTPTSVSLAYEVEFPDSGENSIQWMTWTVPEGQPLVFDAVTVELLAGEPEAGFRVAFDLNTQGTADPAAPLFTTHVVGDRGPDAGPTDAPVALGAGASGPVLAAAPSVTRGQSTFRLARPVAHETALSIVDVRGRRVRELAIPAGAISTNWDGRDRTGRAVAPGVYWAVPSDRPQAAARVVVVR